MMEQEWAAILARFGQEVTLTAPEGEPVSLRAFVQPRLDRQPQLVPSPLGERREERWLYLGPPENALTAGETVAVWNGRKFSVETARQVWAGISPSHWWAVLRPEDKEADL